MLDFDKGSSQTNFFREFTSWWPWSKRQEVPDGHGYKAADYAGVYLLAHFDGNAPGGAATHLDDQIIYVGEGSRLRGRWRQFERSARHGLSGHSGGFSYRDAFGGDRWDQLHVAALPIWFGDDSQPSSSEPWTQAYRLYVERRILWDLTVHRQREPYDGATRVLLNLK
jgi:hypothetical protein